MNHPVTYRSGVKGAVCTDCRDTANDHPGVDDVGVDATSDLACDWCSAADDADLASQQREQHSALRGAR